MKRCPECGREYDSGMMFCLDDKAELLYDPASADETGDSDFARDSIAGRGRRSIRPNILRFTRPRSVMVQKGALTNDGFSLRLPSWSLFLEVS